MWTTLKVGFYGFSVVGLNVGLVHNMMSAFHLRKQVIWKNQQAVRHLAQPAIDGVTEPLEIAESGLFNISWNCGLSWQVEHAYRFLLFFAKSYIWSSMWNVRTSEGCSGQESSYETDNKSSSVAQDISSSAWVCRRTCTLCVCAFLRISSFCIAVAPFLLTRCVGGHHVS